MPEILRTGPAPVSPSARAVLVPMRDGVRLAADVYLPPGPEAGDDGPGDTVLIRLPYDKSGPYTFVPLIAEHFTARGYRVVAQDVRGKFRSGGEALLFVNEARDGYDTLQWIVDQPWSNGRVAMWGDSYYGFTQWAAASSEHPALKAIAPRVTGTQLGEPVRRRRGDDGGGDERVSAVEWAITYLYPLTHFHSRDTFSWDLDPARRPYSAQAEEVVAQLGARSASYDLWYPHPVHLPRFPTGSCFDARPVPTLHTIGWWDNCAPLSWADVAEISARPAWALNHFLRVESMDHESYYLDDDDADRVEERSEEQLRAQLPRMLDPALDFFEVFVRGRGRHEDVPRVAWNLAGTPGMRTSTSWPPPGTTEQTLFGAPLGLLVPEPPEAVAVLEWTHDPDAPVPSSAPNAFAHLLHRPDEAPLGDRDDVLVFTAARVAEHVDLVGPVTATARIRSDGPVMDLFVKLLDLAPDGTALRVARGQVQLSGADEVATETADVVVDLGQVGYRLGAGHRLCVHVASSDSPEFLTQPGTGQEPWGAEVTRTNRQRLVLGGAQPFRVTVSVLEGAPS